MTTIYLISTSTSNGPFHLVLDSNETVRLSGFGDIPVLMARLPLDLHGSGVIALDSHRYQKTVTSYYAGDVGALDTLPRQQSGSSLQEQVWQAIGEIPAGHTISYKELAKRAGRPGASRAVGTVCGQNKLILLVPCHRILKSDGGIGHYLYGPSIKASLLRHEGVYPPTAAQPTLL